MGVGANVLLRTCKRKEERKNKKRLKKMQKIAHATHTRVEDVVASSFSQRASEGVAINVVKHPLGHTNNEKRPKKRKRRKHTSSAAMREKRRKEELKRSIEEDEAQIKRYATLLGYRKRKSKNMPQVFRAEGLDYLLELCDPVKRRELSAEESEQSESDAEEIDEERTETGEINLNESSTDSDADVSVKQQAKRVSFADTAQVHCQKNERQLSASESDPQCDEEEELRAEDVQDSEEDNKDEDSNIKEDIYGRLVDRKTGEIVSKGVDARQRLIQLEKETSAAQSEERIKLEKNLRGIINRLNENTVVSSVKNVGSLFASHAHNDVKEVLFDALYKSVSVGFRLPDRILIEYALFIALLHSTVSVEMSSHFVESLIVRLVGVIPSPPDDKSLENICILLAEMYNFKVIKASMVKEILDRMRVTVSDKLLECSKLALSYSGAVMKSRDSDVLQRYVGDVQAQLSQLPKERLQEQHLRFMVEDFMDIKNANIRKWTDAVDRTLFDHYISIFRGLTKKVEKEAELGMSVDDIEHVGERGRWWLVGSAWQPAPSADMALTSTRAQAEDSAKFDERLLALARKAHMNTTLRRNIFCTLLSSQDELDAFERLMRLSLKGQQEREIIHICVHCALREPSYNPFYAAVLTHFCMFHKRFRLTTQYALWDRIRELHNLETWQRRLLAAVIADLILNKSLGLTVLKVIEFGTIDLLTTRFLRRLLTTLLTRASEVTLAEIFGSIVSSPKHKLFSQGLQLFVDVALRKEHKGDKQTVLLSRIDFLDSIWHSEHF